MPDAAPQRGVAGLFDALLPCADRDLLGAALALDVFAALARQGGSSDANALAEEIGADPAALARLLDACAARGLLGKEEETYFNTPADAAFCGPAAESLKALFTEDAGGLRDALVTFVRTGRAAVGCVCPRESERAARTWAACAAACFECAEGARLVDLSSSSARGAWGAALALAHPTLAIVSEEAAPCDAAVIGSGLDGVREDEARALLARAARALAPGGRLFVSAVLTDRTRTAPAYAAEAALLAALRDPAARVFSEDELRGLLDEAGFDAGPVHFAPFPRALVSAVRGTLDV